MKSLLLCLCLLLSTRVASAAVVISMLSSNDLDKARLEGTNGLAALKGMVTLSNYQLLGFHSTNEVPGAINAEPLVIYSLACDKLTNFVSGQSLDTVIDTRPKRTIIPVMVGTNVRSSVILRPLNPGNPAGTPWKTEAWGNSHLIRDLMDTYSLIAPADVQTGTVPFVVDIPVFDIWLVGYLDTTGQLQLRATSDLHLGPVTVFKYEFITDAAMTQLGTTAKLYNGLPN